MDQKKNVMFVYYEVTNNNIASIYSFNYTLYETLHFLIHLQQSLIYNMYHYYNVLYFSELIYWGTNSLKMMGFC
jgi:hypothetical protein